MNINIQQKNVRFMSNICKQQLISNNTSATPF